MASTYSPTPIRMTAGKVAIAGAAFGLLFAPTFGFFISRIPPHVTLDYLTLAILALASGGIFALLIGWFGNSRLVERETAFTLPAGETLVQEGFANHFRSVEARGGRLYLTDRNLIFQPHKINVQSKGLTIARGDIANASTVMTFGGIPNGLKITRHDGTTERFVVNDRSTWVRNIMEPIDQAA